MQFLLVDAARVPGEELDPGAVEATSGALRSKASTIRDLGADYVSAWQTIGEHYEAPEAPQLLGSMNPVRDEAELVATDTHRVCDHLDDHATTLRTLVDKRKALIAEIEDFRRRVAAETDGLGGVIADIGISLTLPPHLMTENDALQHRLDALGGAITEAEEECAARIRAVDAPAAPGWAGQFADAVSAGAGQIADTLGWGDSDEIERFTDSFLNDLLNGSPNLLLPGGLALAGLAGGAGLGQGGGTGQQVFNDWLRGLENGIKDGQQWIDDAVSDFGAWWMDRVETIGDDWANVGDASVEWWNAVEPGSTARVTEVSASTLRWLGAVSGALGTTAVGGTIAFNQFDDGNPWASTINDDVSQEFDGSGTPQLAVPRGLDGLARGMVDAYDAGTAVGGAVVRVTTIDGPDGPKVVVTVPGTDFSFLGWSPLASPNLPNDLTGNLVTAGGGQSTMTDAVRMAMEQADIPEGADVLMIGHSQGGMTTAKLTSDPDFVEQFNVTDVITLGSPIDSDSIDPGVNVLEIKHDSDTVAKLDLGDARLTGMGSPEKSQNHTIVTLDDPSHFLDGYNNHIEDKYLESIQDTHDADLAAAEQRLRDSGFLLEADGTGVDDRVSGQDIQVGRTD
ncbi:hypothetical protein [Myceligenerans crystallogenes]|uniref:PGAP1-like protein n=1 Tax=Myceligenerans crystallogenes TaxID=316335 RepID=A0ABN2N956_9MICO